MIFFGSELKIRQQIYVPAGKGKTSFVDTRDIAEVVLTIFKITTDFEKLTSRNLLLCQLILKIIKITGFK